MRGYDKEGITMSAPKPNRNEVERLILASIGGCTFCGSTEITFTWGNLVPKKMRCIDCDASWEPFMSYDGVWNLVSARLVSIGSTGEGKDLLNKMRPPLFWKKMFRSGFKKWTHEEKLQTIPKQPEKVVIIREIVKIRCPYCGGLYDEVNNRCPYCDGKR